MNRYKIIFSYDGSKFYGYSKQIDKRTVQEEVEKSLSKILNEDIKIYASGRTDRGVHALNQVADFVIDKKIENTTNFLYQINKVLPEDIYIKKINRVNINFSSRFSSKIKIYEYRINLKEYNPLMREYEYFNSSIINVEAMKETSKLFIGTKCFKDFTSKKEDENNFIRTIYSIDFKLKKGILLIEFKGDGFMRYEVRKIVGTLIEIGKNKIDNKFIENHLNSTNRDIVNYTAFSGGLYLKKVEY